MTFHLVDESVNPNAGGPAPIGDAFLPMQDSPTQKVAVEQQVMVDGADLTDAQASQDPQTGGLIYAQYGRGYYVYLAYAFFREMPEGVPGSFRIMANLLSIDKNPGLGH